MSNSVSKILVVALYDLTPLYHKISLRLKDEMIECHWLVTKTSYAKWLIKNGVSEDMITCLTYQKESVPHVNDELLSYIARVESAIDLTLNQAILMDRFLCEELTFDYMPYVYQTVKNIKQLLGKIQPDMIFMEPTNITELVTYMLATYESIPVRCIMDMRFPRNRVVIFHGFLQKDISINTGNKKHLFTKKDGEDLLLKFETDRMEPFTFDILNGRQKIDFIDVIKRVKKGVQSIFTERSSVTLTQYNKVKRFTSVFVTNIRAKYMSVFFRHDDLNKVNGKIAYFALHVQPEMSIDVLGSYFSDQLKLIKDIRRALPANIQLVVKEHPNFIGAKTISMMRDIRNLPNTHLIDYRTSSFDIYPMASIVYTVSGTIAYESGMLGIPAITFSPMYFGGFSSIRYCKSVNDLKIITQELLDNFSRDYEHDCEFMAELMNHSWDGYWTDCIFDPFVLNDANVENLSNVIKHEVRNISG